MNIKSGLGKEMEMQGIPQLVCLFVQAFFYWKFYKFLPEHLLSLTKQHDTKSKVIILWKY